MEMPQYRNFNESIRKKFTADGKPPVVLGDGNPRANVAIFGYEPDEEEVKPFTGNHNGLFRVFAERTRLAPFATYLSYVIKQRPAKRLLPWKEVKPWSDLAFEELEIVRAKATILFGIETAWGFAGFDEPDIEKLRKRQFLIERNPATCFFVTYSPLEVIKFGGIDSEVGRAWTDDMTAVFDVNHSYFQKVICK